MPRKEPAPKPAKREDVVLVRGRTDDGEGHVVLRKRGETIALGEVRPMREGKPVHGEVVKLTPREGAPHLADVEVLHAAAEPASRGGPAQVATTAYRQGWSSIFGGADQAKPQKKPTARLLN